MESAYLQVKDAKGKRKVVLDEGPLTIGRNFTNMLALDENMASRFHCVIERTEDGYQVRDLESRNVTAVNGQLVRAAILHEGDIITIGKAEMVLVVAYSHLGPSPRAVVDDAANLLAELADGESSSRRDEDSEQDDATEPTVESFTATTMLTGTDYEAKLRERADSLADRSFDEEQIAFFNARGKPTLEAGADAGDAVTLLRLIILISFRCRATDVHVEPKIDDVHVRLRVDGMLIDLVRLSKELGVKLSSVVKVLSDIDIAQRNSVQEGHFSTRVPGTTEVGNIRRVDYRVSFVPSTNGQKLVIRVLDAAISPLHISDLHLPPRALEIIRKTSGQDSGMILVCGPTGSGKTTTLYAALRDIDSRQRNVVTIEDPVEIQLEGITQLPVNDAQGNSFSALLRSVLRQDPDVILVGEIRDAETARVAVQAGMTGHLVFSTVHARDTVSGMFRLLDLGVEPYVVASGLHVVVAQRLVRQLCPYCKKSRVPTTQESARLEKNGFPGIKKIYEARQCRRCLGTGHFGRRAVFEILNTDTALRETVIRTQQQNECLKSLTAENYISMASSGYQLAAEGVASLEEVENTIA